MSERRNQQAFIPRKRELVWYVQPTMASPPDPPEMWPADPAEVLAEMGAERVWVCFIDQRITDKKWCRHQASRCGYYQIVKEHGHE